MRIKVKKPIYQAFIAFLGILSVASALAGTSILFVHSDHLGTPQAMTDQNQRVVWKANYKPFGEAEVDEDPDGDGVAVEMPLRFPGQYFDKETGLHYNWHRDYDPTLGRYLQSDPIGLEGGLNTYVYVESNPLIYVDPDGLILQTLPGIGTGAAVGLGAGAVICALVPNHPSCKAARDLIDRCINSFGSNNQFKKDDVLENDDYTGHGENPEGKTGSGGNWDKHSGRRAGKRYGGNRNQNRGERNKKYIKPKNPNKRPK